MRVRFNRAPRRACALAGLLLVAAIGSVAHPQTAVAAQLIVTGDVQKPLSLSLEDLRHLTRTTVKATNEHEGNKEEVYEGVLLLNLLKQAGVPQGRQLRGAAMAKYVVAEGSDGYRVTFSIAELDSSIQDSDVIVADTLNGAPLGEKLGPLRLVVPHDKRPARWVRTLRSIKVVNVGG
jgi:DMSO/TMAO reductase YedYZ molybdopterin-dependent catalytic subunit